MAKSKSIALPSPTKERVEFGKLKRIRSGEVLTGSPERETESDSTLERSFEMGASDVTDHHLNDVTSRHMKDVTARHANDAPVRHSDSVPLFEQADYEDSPHFPRDKTKFNVSPTKAQPGSGGGSINHSASLKVSGIQIIVKATIFTMKFLESYVRIAYFTHFLGRTRSHGAERGFRVSRQDLGQLRQVRASHGRQRRRKTEDEKRSKFFRKYF